jgi:uncharacterized RDD family membrane protein YckC
VADRFDTAAFIAPTFGQRLLGRIIDSLITLPVFVVIGLALNGFVSQVIPFTIAAAYEIIGIAVWGQTFGKRIVGTRVVSMVSVTLQPEQAVVRFLAYGGLGFLLTAVGANLVGELVTLVVVLPVLRAPLHRGLHDVAARTIVVPTRSWSAPPSLR